MGQGRKRPLTVSKTALENGLNAAMITSIITASGSTLELSSNLINGLKRTSAGYGSGAARRFVVERLEKLDRLQAQRKALVEANKDHPDYKRALAESEVFDEMRRSFVNEFAHFYTDNRRTKVFQNSFFTLNAAYNTVGAIAAGIGSQSLTHPRYTGTSNILFIVSGGMVMEYLDGELFSSACKSGYLTVDQLIELFKDVCEGVRHAHQKKILHRDLKPSNIIVCRLDNGDYQAKVVDFGIAKHLQSDGGITAEGEIIGSPLYMAPEQGRAVEVDERSDVYALGCVMYEALAHRPPLKGATALETIAMHESTVPEPVSAAASMAVPAWLDSVIMTCLAKSPGDRFQSMTELLAALDAGPQTREEQSVSEPADRPGATGWRASPVALFVTAIVLVGLIVWTFSLGKREIPPDGEKKKRDNVNALSGDGSKVSTSLEEKNSIRDGSDPPFGVRPSKYIPTTLIARCRDDSEAKLCNQFKNVEFIDFKYSPITGSGFKDLKGLDKVWKVRIGSGPIEDRYLKDLKRLPALRRLEIEQVDSLDGSGLKDLDGLRTLEIVKCALSDKMFDGIASIATLEMLCLKDCSGIDAENLSKVKLLKMLKALELSDSYLDDYSLAGLENASLKELNLGQNSGC